MLKRIIPVQYGDRVKNGRTEPLFISCETDEGKVVDVVAKFSGAPQCFEGNAHLAREVIAACLANDLHLPVPEPYLIEISPEWIKTVPSDQQAIIQKSSSVAFGSSLMTPQYSIWNVGYAISDTMLPIAAAILVFDGIIHNTDRRTGNPNCLVKGNDLIIIDHEMAFLNNPGIIGWLPPWAVGGLNYMITGEKHIFTAGLKNRLIDFAAIRNAWLDLSDNQIMDYERALPKEWCDAANAASIAIKLIKDGRDNIDAVLEVVKRVLS